MQMGGRVGQGRQIQRTKAKALCTEPLRNEALSQSLASPLAP